MPGKHLQQKVSYFPSLKQPQFWGLIWSLIEMFQTVDYKGRWGILSISRTFSRKQIAIRKTTLSDCLKTAKPLNDKWAATPFLARRICPGCGAKEASAQRARGHGPCPQTLPWICFIPISPSLFWARTEGYQMQHYFWDNNRPLFQTLFLWCRGSITPSRSPFIIFLSSLCHHTWPCW